MDIGTEKNSKLAIFGANGFVGSNIVSFLTNPLYKVNLREKQWEKAIPAETDVFINCIGKAHDHGNKFSEQDFFESNYQLVKAIYKAFLQSKAQLLIHISTIAVVEEIASDDFLTENSQHNHTSIYARSKYEGEKYLLSQEIPPGKKIIILRPPMIHGSGDKGSLSLLYKFITKKIPYPLLAFHNKRSFISIDNLSFFIQKIIENKTTIAGGVYHIADDEPVATNEIVNIIKGIHGIKSKEITIPKKIIVLMAKIGDYIPIPLNTIRLKKMTSTLLVSNAKIKQALHIEKLPLTAQEGLTKTIQSFKK